MSFSSLLGRLLRNGARASGAALVFVSAIGAATPPPQPQPDARYKVIHAMNFSTEGTGPDGALIMGTDGAFYGTLCNGGLTGHVGSVYRVTTKGDLTIVHGFASDEHEGAAPCSGLVLADDGWMYGTTSAGGAHKWGAAYRVKADGSFELLHSFSKKGVRGYQPLAPLTLGADGDLYGTTRSGGDHGYGTAFRMSREGKVKTLHSFGANGDGNYPTSALVQASDGNFYGVGFDSGSESGIIFRMRPNGETKVITSFPGNDHRCLGSQSPLIEGKDGKLWGLCSGGRHAYGLLYNISLKGKFRSVRSFTPEDNIGRGYYSRLVDDGTSFYATSDSETGSVFRVTYEGAVTLLHRFVDDGVDGWYPTGVVVGPDGFIYGSTKYGGSDRAGLVYRASRQ